MTDDRSAAASPESAQPAPHPPTPHQPARRPRPRSLDPRELGFTPQRPVPWLAPLLLLSTGLRTLLAMLFGAYLDKRELQNSLPQEVPRHEAVNGELWLDYVADLGDGFDATYSVAYLLAQRELTIDGERLRRGDILVMGGDQVYPTASKQAYEDRCKGPYRAALPEAPTDGPRPTLYAVPGNHDWYDGLTAFLRVFARRRDATIGGWRTRQSRSYFAVELPGRWWLFGLDSQFTTYLDDPQLSYFENVARRLGPDDRVIIAVPEPSWVKAAHNPEAYDSLDYFIRTVIAPTGAQVRLILSGDLHHYARYTGPERELITCGGGGAYLYPTHQLPETITVPPRDSLVRAASPHQVYRLASRYPDATPSRRYAWGIFPRLPFRNPGFTLLLGALHTLLLLTMAGVATQQVGGPEQRLFSIPLAVTLLGTMLAAILFAKTPSASGARRARHWVLLLGGAHGLGHIALAAAGTWLWVRLNVPALPYPLPTLVAVVGYGPVIGLVASQVTALYLFLAGRFDINLNELFAGQGIEDSKSFLRMRIAADGSLTIYPIALDRIGRRWRANPDGPPDAPWIEPVTPLQPRLVEPPVTLR